MPQEFNSFARIYGHLLNDILFSWILFISVLSDHGMMTSLTLLMTNMTLSLVSMSPIMLTSLIFLLRRLLLPGLNFKTCIQTKYIELTMMLKIPMNNNFHVLDSCESCSCWWKSELVWAILWGMIIIIKLKKYLNIQFMHSETSCEAYFGAHY